MQRIIKKLFTRQQKLVQTSLLRANYYWKNLLRKIASLRVFTTVSCVLVYIATNNTHLSKNTANEEIATFVYYRVNVVTKCTKKSLRPLKRRME